jgi:hypothetical protein
MKETLKIKYTISKTDEYRDVVEPQCKEQTFSNTVWNLKTHNLGPFAYFQQKSTADTIILSREIVLLTGINYFILYVVKY